MAALNLFPARIRFVNADGTLTPEAYRALQDVLSRIGGPLGNNGGDTIINNDFASVEAQQTAGGDITADVFASQDTQADSEMVLQPSSAFNALSGPISQSGLTTGSNSLLGRGTTGTGAIESISVGAGLTLAGTTLSATGTSGMTAPAGEAIGGHRAVVLAASGSAFYADNTNPDHFFRFDGITLNAAAIGDPLSIVQTGIVTEPTWAWTTYGAIYLSTTGLLTQTPPATGFMQVIGVALSATSIFVNQRDPIVTI